MGRKRAAFAEGIAEEEQRYAQVLRDIRDLRGETQQALGRLLGWSISTVSRFEAGTERPDEATHRRYCALASTDELRQRAMAAYKALPAPPVRMIATAIFVVAALAVTGCTSYTADQTAAPGPQLRPRSQRPSRPPPPPPVQPLGRPGPRPPPWPAPPRPAAPSPRPGDRPGLGSSCPAAASLPPSRST
jgi:transcriptional regulator with XRE-family HTH domain